jgi:hypothetical protein
MFDALAVFAVARGQFVGALLQFAEEAGVFQRDDCLVRKGADEFDLPVGKGLHPSPRDSDHTAHDALTQKRHAETGSDSSDRNGLGEGLFRVGSEVVDMDDLTRKRGPSHEHPSVRRKQSASKYRLVLGRLARGCHHPVSVVSAVVDRRAIGVAEPRSGLRDGLEHRLDIESRAADDLEHVAGRGLVFERFLQVAGALLQLAEQPRILHRDHRLGGEILQQRDLLVRKRPHLLPVGRYKTKNYVVLE